MQKISSDGIQAYGNVTADDEAEACAELSISHHGKKYWSGRINAVRTVLSMSICTHWSKKLFIFPSQTRAYLASSSSGTVPWT